MEILINHPETKEQLIALKSFLKVLNVNFEVKENNIMDNRKFDFSTIAGKLSWQGNALEEQKKIRAEWQSTSLSFKFSNRH
jgi:hypothetical protein